MESKLLTQSEIYMELVNYVTICIIRGNYDIKIYREYDNIDRSTHDGFIETNDHIYHITHEFKNNKWIISIKVL